MRFRVRVLALDGRKAARREIARTGADEAGIAKMTDKAQGFALKVEGLKSAGANILKQEALSVGADAAVSRGVINCSVPVTDAVIMGTGKQLKKLMTKLKPQPFGLKTLAAEMADALDAAARPIRWVLPDRVFDLDARPLIMGIVNVTPDSFSDGGDNFNPDKALRSAERMARDGADIIDVGGESTRPGAQAVGEDEEAARVVPLIRRIKEATGLPVSVDTYKSGVASEAVAAGASVINDVSGLRLDPAIAGVAASTGAGLVLMHMRGTPRDMQTDTVYRDMVGEIYGLLAESVQKAVDAGVDPERIVVDPGIGFGKSVSGNLVLLKRLGEFVSLGRPVLVGASRKSFIGKTLGLDAPKDRLEGSLAAAVLAVANGARIIRCHDVLPTRRALDLAWAALGAEEE